MPLDTSIITSLGGGVTTDDTRYIISSAPPVSWWWSWTWSTFFVWFFICMILICSGLVAYEEEVMAYNKRRVARENATIRKQQKAMKCLLLGSPRVGKTTFMCRYNGQSFYDSFHNRHHTIGVEFVRQMLHLRDEATINEEWHSREFVAHGLEHMIGETKPAHIEVPTLVWDMYTHHRFGARMSPSYYRGSDVIFLLYDSLQTLGELGVLLQNARQHAPDHCRFVLVLTKCDDEEKNGAPAHPPMGVTTRSRAAAKRVTSAAAATSSSSSSSSTASSLMVLENEGRRLADEWKCHSFAMVSAIETDRDGGSNPAYGSHGGRAPNRGFASSPSSSPVTGTPVDDPYHNPIRSLILTEVEQAYRQKQRDLRRAAAAAVAPMSPTSPQSKTA